MHGSIASVSNVAPSHQQPEQSAEDSFIAVAPTETSCIGLHALQGNHWERAQESSFIAAIRRHVESREDALQQISARCLDAVRRQMKNHKGGEHLQTLPSLVPASGAASGIGEAFKYWGLPVAVVASGIELLHETSGLGWAPTISKLLELVLSWYLCSRMCAGLCCWIWVSVSEVAFCCRCFWNCNINKTCC